MPPDDHQRAVIAIESWILRRLIIGSNTRGYAKRFVDVLKAGQAAAGAGASIAMAVEASLLDVGTDNLMWPTDEEIETAFVNRPFYGNLTQERICMLLGAIDRQMHLDHPKGEHPTFDYDALQIEHILPRTWMSHWPVLVCDDAERMLLEQERDRVKNRMGNLTLVTGPLNVPMSNGPWPGKRAALAEHSTLRLNAGLFTLDTWDEAAIEKRARDLAAVARKVWPRPQAAE